MLRSFRNLAWSSELVDTQYCHLAYFELNKTYMCDLWRCDEVVGQVFESLNFKAKGVITTIALVPFLR